MPSVVVLRSAFALPDKREWRGMHAWRAFDVFCAARDADCHASFVRAWLDTMDTIARTQRIGRWHGT